jgi:hypothetical protein
MFMISIAQRKDKISVDKLHIQTINQCFLPKLGNSFLKILYQFLIAKEWFIKKIIKC